MPNLATDTATNAVPKISIRNLVATVQLAAKRELCRFCEFRGDITDSVTCRSKLRHACIHLIIEPLAVFGGTMMEVATLFADVSAMIGSPSVLKLVCFRVECRCFLRAIYCVVGVVTARVGFTLRVWVSC